MTRAASARASIARRSGSADMKTGAMPQSFAQRIRVRATDVRELMSSASVRTRSIGTVVKIATESTGPSDPMAISGTIA